MLPTRPRLGPIHPATTGREGGDAYVVNFHTDHATITVAGTAQTLTQWGHALIEAGHIAQRVEDEKPASLDNARAAIARARDSLRGRTPSVTAIAASTHSSQAGVQTLTGGRVDLTSENRVLSLMDELERSVAKAKEARKS